MSKFTDNIQTIAETKQTQQKAVKPIVTNNLGEKLGYRSIGYQDFNGQDPIPPENKPQDNLTDGSYAVADVIDGINEPKLPSEALGTLTNSYDLEDNSLNLLLKVNGVFETLDDASGTTTYYTNVDILGQYLLYAQEDPSAIILPQFSTDFLYFYETVDEAWEATQYIYEHSPGYINTFFENPTEVELPLWTFENQKTYEYGINQEGIDENEGVNVDYYGYIFEVHASTLPVNWDSEDPFYTPASVTMPPGDPPDYGIAGDPSNQTNPPYIFAPPTSTSVLQLARNGNDKLWYPDPDFDNPPLIYTTHLSVLQVGFGDNRIAKVEPTKEGGVMLYEVDDSDDPIGYARIYKINRTLDSIIPAIMVFSKRP